MSAIFKAKQMNETGTEVIDESTKYGCNEQKKNTQEIETTIDESDEAAKVKYRETMNAWLG